MSVIPIDLEHMGLPGAIATYLVMGDEPMLVDPGPSTTLETLEGRLRDQGVRLEDIRHLLLTHVHLDHAGASGHLAGRVPALRVHVHVDGAPHVADPERLVASTRRTFGDAHDRLWGDVRPVPADRIRAWTPGEPGGLRHTRPFHTPGHIGHHVAWLDERTGTLLAGDAMGIVIHPSAPVHPPTPPPTVDLEAWRTTLTLIGHVGPERFGAAHFGLHEDPHGRRMELQARLDAFEERVAVAMAEGRVEGDAEAYEEEVRSEQAAWLPRDRADRYFDTFRAAIDYRGMVRYLEKRDGRPEPPSKGE
jgi:glyoxylase-like metal-dependent hydrolase (beta-lactamase superfamily II)